MFSAVLLVVLLLLAPTLSFGQAACTRYASPAGAGTQDGMSQANPYRLTDFINRDAAPGAVLCLLNGTYTNDWLEFGSTPSGSPGNPITVRALTDGGVFIDGQHAHRTLFFNGTSYWTVQGIDFGNAGGSDTDGASFYSAHHITVQRVCVWNATTPTAGVYTNSHTIMNWNSHHLLFEDICAFGWGRNTYINFDPNTRDNVLRRVWLRWDGYPDGAGASCPGGTIQSQYYTQATNDVHENFISIFSGGLYHGLYSGPSDPNHFSGFPCDSLGANWGTRAGLADNSQGAHWNGFIVYGYPANNDILADDNNLGLASRWVPIYFQDVFSDSRFGRAGARQNNINLYACDVADPAHVDQAVGSDCTLFHADRLTSIRNADQQPAVTRSPTTNFNDCTSLGACPNFYTGTSPGTGSRACFEYNNGTLTSTPLWPWRMDDRIKQALARGGIGPALAGTAGPGYAAGTVTSEIVSRYGAVPAQCSRSGGALVPSITSTLSATGQVGTAFSYQITATNSPTSYDATGLPAGLSVNTSTGVISGTPTVGGTSSVTLSATNSSGTGNATLTLAISTGTIPTITSPLTATGSIVTAFSYQITATNSPTSYGATGLPSGLSVSTSTGLISGTPAAAGTSSVALSASNASGTGNATLTLTITTLPTPTPNAWWKFDENTGTAAADATNNGHTITLNGGASWGAPKVGVSALRCNGATIGPSTADAVFDNPQYTWMGWLRSDTAPSNTLFQAPIANGPTNAGTDAWGLWWSSQDAPGTLNVQTIFHTDASGSTRFKIPVALAAHLWYHLAATYDGTTVRVYLNGQLQGSFAAGTPVTPSGPFQVCGKYFPTPWAGDLDEWQVLDHPLTAAQILTEYQRGTATSTHVPHKILAQ